MLRSFAVSAFCTFAMAACGPPYVLSEDADPTLNAASTTGGTTSTGGGTTTGGSTTTGGGTTTGGSTTGTPSDPNCGKDTYANFGKAFFAANCVDCHSNQASLSGINADATNIETNIDSGAMPQGGKLSANDKARVLAWLACGLPP